METQVCSKCGIEKTVDQYSKSDRNKKGILGTCKQCRSEYDKKYRETFKDTRDRSDYKKAYYEKKQNKIQGLE